MFVQIAGDSEVKAQVRLLFRDVRQQRCVAIRSLVATQKVHVPDLSFGLDHVHVYGLAQLNCIDLN